MELGLVGLGKMGGNMRTRLRNAGHTVVGFDRNPDVSDAGSLAEMVGQLPSPKVVWVMVPAGDPTRDTVKELAGLLGEGDLVVDGGNSKWTDDQINADLLAEKGIGFVDCGVSGGVWGLKNGYALMCGGSDENVAKVQPAFDALKPEGDSGFVHAGSTPGAGHFSKMVHNGIEYAIMQAYAEGWELLDKVDMVENVTDVFNSWREGTVIRSWLLDLLVAALQEDAHLDKIAGYAADSGEGRWTVEAGIDNGVAMPAIAGLPVRALRLAAGRQPGDEGGRGDAQPVRRSRGEDRGPSRRRRVVVRRSPEPGRLPLLRPRGGPARARSDGVHRPQRPGQDQPGRGDRLPVAARLPPGRRRRTAGARRRRARRWCAPPWCATGERRCSRSRSTPGRSNRARVNRAELPRARELVGLVRTVIFAPDDLALVKGDPSGRRAFLDDLLVLRAPRLAGVRQDYERVLKQRNSLLKTAGTTRAADRRRRSPRCRRSVSGTPTWPAPAARSWPSGCGWSPTCAPTSATPTPPWPAARRATTPAWPTSRASRSARSPTGPP